MTPLVIARDLEIRGRLLPTNVDLDAGSLTALAGPNGSGKTSLLHALAGVSPARGSVFIGGQQLQGKPPGIRQRLVGLLPAEREISWPICGRDLLKLGLVAPRDVAETIARFELEALLERRIDRLSSGERARLLLGRLRMAAPQLLLLDEPLANLDPYWQLIVMEQLRTFAREQGSAVVLAIHDLATAARAADRLLLMKQGAIAWDGPAAELMRSGEADRVFGALWTGSGWKLSQPEDQQSSP